MAVLGAAAWIGLAGCGQPGPPLPPSADLPQLVRDLSAQRRGPVVDLSWTAPARTTDGAGIHGPVSVEVCIWPGVVATIAAVAPGTIAPPAPPVAAAATNPGLSLSPSGSMAAAPETAAAPPGGPAAAVYEPACPAARPLLPAALAPPAYASVKLDQFPAGVAQASVAIEYRNHDGKTAGWSNAVTISAAPVAPPPQDVAAVSRPDGVQLSWQAPQPAPPLLRVYRVAASGPPPSPPAGRGTVQLPLPRAPAAPPAPMLVATLPGDQDTFLDTTREWNRSYRYWLRSADGDQPGAAESADSNLAAVATPDIFAPPVPTGLEVLLSPGPPAGIDLSWEAVAVEALAGYNVYRRVGDGPWQKRNSVLAPTPVFHDSLDGLAPGAGLQYAVSSVGRNGSESVRSVPAALQLPRQQ